MEHKGHIGLHLEPLAWALVPLDERIPQRTNIDQAAPSAQLAGSRGGPIDVVALLSAALGAALLLAAFVVL